MNTPNFIITCDGGSRGNGAENSVGYGSFEITSPKSKGSVCVRREFGLGVTNNEAEYLALIASLNYVVSTFGHVGKNTTDMNIKVRTDSALIIGHLVTGWKIQAENLKPLVAQARELMEKFHEVSFEKISGDQMKDILGH
jgi:Ribonuclease HI